MQKDRKIQAKDLYQMDLIRKQRKVLGREILLTNSRLRQRREKNLRQKILLLKLPAKVITVKGENTTSKTFGGLVKGKTYYVQVRTYKIENGVRYYSGYCTTKTVKITK